MLFASFWQARSSESASHGNSRGIGVDMIAATPPRQGERGGLRAAAQAWTSASAVRGSAGTSSSRGIRFDFASIVPVMNAASRHGVQVVWSLLPHYGWPDDLDIFSPGVRDPLRSAGERASAEFIAHASDGIPGLRPVHGDFLPRHMRLVSSWRGDAVLRAVVATSSRRSSCRRA